MSDKDSELEALRASIPMSPLWPYALGFAAVVIAVAVLVLL